MCVQTNCQAAFIRTSKKYIFMIIQKSMGYCEFFGEILIMLKKLLFCVTKFFLIESLSVVFLNPGLILTIVF